MFGFTRSFIVISSLSWILVNAAPVAERQFGSGLEVVDLVARAADASAQPQTIQTKNTVQTAQGPAEEVCTITLTPVTDASGNQVVEKVTTCTYTVNGTNGTNNGSNGGAPGSSDTSTSSDSSTTANGGGALSVGGFFTIPFSAPSSSAPAATSSAPAATSSAPAATSSAAATTTAESSSAQTAASSAAETAASSSVAESSSAASSAATSAATSSPANSGATSAAASQNTSTSQTSASAAAAEATTQSAAFELPGKTLSVLPIGLGVFAGISAIALIVVGLVTYERTKYRKAFRQRKLAEQGGTMGYGGMAER